MTCSIRRLDLRDARRRAASRLRRREQVGGRDRIGVVSPRSAP
jgi:hypothetical protein